MRTYEVLIEKANTCRLAAIRTRGVVSQIWLSKAIALENKADAMSLESAMSNYISEKRLQRGF